MKEVIEEAVCGVDGCSTGPTRAAAAKRDKNARPVHQLTIVSDVICPWCFVAKKNLEKALELAGTGLAVAITWRPFELNPDMPKEGMNRREYRSNKFGSWEQSQTLDAQVASAGKLAGITFHHDLMQRTPNTFNAHRLIWLAGQEGVQDTIVEALFRAYFVEGRDVGNVDVLIDIASRGGIAHDRVQAFFAGHEGVAEVSKAARSASQSGISGVPTFIING